MDVVFSFLPHFMFLRAAFTSSGEMGVTVASPFVQRPSSVGTPHPCSLAVDSIGGGGGRVLPLTYIN